MSARAQPETAPPKRARWSRVVRIVAIVVPLGILGNLAFTLFGTDREVLAALGEFPRHYLLLAVGLAFVPWVTHTLRLTLWTRFLGHRLRLRDGFTIVVGTTLGGAASPTVLGGGVFKWGMLVQKGVSPGEAASLTTLATVEDAVFFLIALPVAFVVSEAWSLPIVRGIGEQVTENLPVAAGLLAIVLLLSWFSLRVIACDDRRIVEERRETDGFLRRFRRRLRNALRDALDTYRLIMRRGRWLFLVTLVLTAIQWTAHYGILSALVAFLGLPVDFVLFFLLQWIVFALMTTIPTPGATGGAEAAFYFIFGALLPSAVIGIATAGWRFLTFYVQISVAAVLFPMLYPQFERSIAERDSG